MDGITIRGKELGEGFYLTSDDLPGFRLYMSQAQLASQDMRLIIVEAINEFLPIYESAKIRQKINQMKLQKRENLGEDNRDKNFEIFAQFEAA